MVYKDFSSETVDQVRTELEKRQSGIIAPFDPQVDFGRIVFSRQKLRHESIKGCFLENAGYPVGITGGKLGVESEAIFAYMLIAFPASDLNYEFIAYRYNPDKFFLFKNGRLTGSLNGQFVSDLRQVNKWEMIVDEKRSGHLDVPSNVLPRIMEVEFENTRPPVPLTTYPPPMYTGFMSALNYYIRRTFAFSLGTNDDYVFPEVPEFNSVKEAEIYFCGFIFFRMMVFSQ